MTLLQRLQTPPTWQLRKNSAAIAVAFTRKITASAAAAH